MAKFCETRFAQSELMVYKNFEMNYNTYRRAWCGDAEAIEPKLDASAAAATATRSATVEATTLRAATTKATTSHATT